MKHRLFRTLLIGLSFAAAAPAALAAWPEKPIRIIIPWAPGGSTDIVGRIMAAELTKKLGQQVIIDNRPGAGSIIGLQLAKAAEPNGYNFMVTSTAYIYLINKSQAKGIDLVDSFEGVALFGFGDSALTVNSKFPVNSVKELIALAKAKPGQLNYSSSGIGGFPHMNTELFKLRTGIDLVHVPFQGGGPAVADTAAGNTQIHLGSLASEMPHIKSGRLKVLAVGGPKPNPALPGVPTISETVPGYTTQIWWGMFAPNGTPKDIINAMNNAINQILDDPDVRKKFEAQGADAQKMSPAEFEKLMATEQNKWAEVIRAAKIKE